MGDIYEKAINSFRKALASLSEEEIEERLSKYDISKYGNVTLENLNKNNMYIEHTAFQVLLLLKDKKRNGSKKARDLAISMLEDSLEYCKDNAKQTKDLLMEFALESKRTKFKLIGRVNTSGIELMEWCDDAYNFNFMCSSIENLETYKDGEYLKSTYTIEELPEVIDSALNWYNSVKTNHHKFNSTSLHILAVD